MNQSGTFSAPSDTTSSEEFVDTPETDDDLNELYYLFTQETEPNTALASFFQSLLDYN